MPTMKKMLNFLNLLCLSSSSTEYDDLRQAEYDELAHRVGSLTDENNGLREELARIRSECEKLASENASLSVSRFPCRLGSLVPASCALI